MVSPVGMVLSSEEVLGLWSNLMRNSVVVTVPLVPLVPSAERLHGVASSKHSSITALPAIGKPVIVPQLIITPLFVTVPLFASVPSFFMITSLLTVKTSPLGIVSVLPSGITKFSVGITVFPINNPAAASVNNIPPSRIPSLTISAVTTPCPVISKMPSAPLSPRPMASAERG